MDKLRVALISGGEPDADLVQQQLQGIEHEFDTFVCKSDGETIEAVKGADVIINQGVPMPRNVIEEIEDAQAVVSFGHGFNHIDHEAATNQSLMVVNTAGFCTEEVSNHAIMLMLACAKKLTILNDLTKAGKWGPDTRTAIMPMAPITDQVLGLVSLGNIGRAVARKAQALGMTVIAYDPYVQPWIAREYRVQLVGNLKELASNSDFVSMHTPLNNQTTKLVGRSFFKSMKSSAYFINTCRGGTVDEEALIEALNNKELAGAGLDVFEIEPTAPDNPLFAMDNVMVTPHSAGSSDRSRVASQIQVGQEAARLLKGTWPMSLVNPEVRSKIEARPVATRT
ncbi:MAG: hydroxyacid dehydrogenase [Chloroflexi bacterium]|nr:hydroxyacid dehydrogenase [Chloroflexota bacterium]